MVLYSSLPLLFLQTTPGEIAKFEKTQSAKGARGVVIVAGDAKKAPVKAVMSFARAHATRGGAQGLYSVEFLFSAVMRQEIDYSVGLVPQIQI
jgi:hypothetical protein